MSKSRQSRGIETLNSPDGTAVMYPDEKVNYKSLV